MLLSDFFTVALVPALVVPGNSSARVETGVTDPFSPFSDEDIFVNDDFFRNPGEWSTKPVDDDSSTIGPDLSDPFLRDIFEEEKRLGLAGGDYDANMDSEEAREIINFQRRKLRKLESKKIPSGGRSGEGSTGRFLFSSEGGQPVFRGPGNERIDARYFTSTQFPILPPGTSYPDEESEMGWTEQPEPMGRMGFGGTFNKVKTGVGHAFGRVTNFFGISKTTTTTTTTTPRPTETGGINFGGSEERPSQNLPSSGSDAVVFGGDYEGPQNLPITELKCNATETEYQGGCYNVLQELPCLPGQWLVEDEETGKGKCVKNRCAHEGKNYAHFGGKCVRVGDRNSGDCHKGMRTYIFKNGDVECDCDDLHLFDQRDGNCYPANRKGPCTNGEIFIAKITKLGTLPASCVRSKCSKDGFFCNAPMCPRDRNCVALGSPCPGGVYAIDHTNLSVRCEDLSKTPQRIIGNVPTLACAPGSRRDILGTCRKPTKVTFS